MTPDPLTRAREALAAATTPTARDYWRGRIKGLEERGRSRKGTTTGEAILAGAVAIALLLTGAALVDDEYRAIGQCEVVCWSSGSAYMGTDDAGCWCSRTPDTRVLVPRPVAP